MINYKDEYHYLYNTVIPYMSLLEHHAKGVKIPAELFDTAYKFAQQGLARHVVIKEAEK